MADNISDTIPISVQGADVLTPTVRIFYEQTYTKSMLALVYTATAFMFLGFASYYGGWTSFFAGMIDKHKSFPVYGEDMQTKGYFIKFALINDPNKLLPLAQGYGFATFCQVLAFFLALSAAIIISPWITGTFQEKTILRTKKALELQ